MYKKSLIVLLVLVVAALGGTAYGLRDSSDAETLAEGTAQEEQAADVVVYVTGAVNKPGVVTLKDGTRVADAVQACGGLLPTAASDKLNMAQALKDGQQIRVPEKAGAKNANQGKSDGKDSKSGGKSGGAGDGAQGVVNINTADEKELDSLPGVGPAMAKRIVEYRESNGGFQSPEELKKVRGIGDAKFEKMKERVSI